MYHQRTAIYFPVFSEDEWKKESVAYAQAHAQRLALAARLIDEVYLGEMQPERDHGLVAERSEPVTYLGRKGRILQGPGFFQLTMRATPEAAILQAVFWGEERNREIDIMVDGKVIATERLLGSPTKQFVAVDYDIPPLPHRDSITVRFQSKNGHWTSVYGCRLLKIASSS